MPNYGLTSTGFLRMRLPEIVEAIKYELKTTTGLDFDTDPESVTGQFISVFAEREASLWEIMQAVYLSMYPPSASGVALDDAVSFTGVRRLPNVVTQVPVVLYGTLGTVIEADSIARSTQASGNYLLNADVTISYLAVVEGEIAVTVLNSNTYTLNIAGVSKTYTSDASATIAEIFAGLSALYATSHSFIVFSLDGLTIKVKSSDFRNFSLSANNGLAVSKYGCKGSFRRELAGSDGPPVGTLTEILTPVSGWSGLNNPFEATLGRLEEADSELRSRYRLGVFNTGAGNIDAIKANLLGSVAGVSYVSVYQNKTNTTDAFSRPAHSVEAVVVGGDNQEICNLLLLKVAAGIDTYGNYTGSAIDSQGVTQVIKFSRPVSVKGWLKITISQYSEETITENASFEVSKAAINFGNSMNVGVDILTQRFIGPIFDAVQGLSTVVVEVATGETTPATYTTNNIALDIRSKAIWDYSRTTVIIT